MSKAQNPQQRKPPQRFVTTNGLARFSVCDEKPKRGDLVVYLSRGKYGMGIWDGEAIFVAGRTPLPIGKARKLVGVVRDIEV